MFIQVVKRFIVPCNSQTIQEWHLFLLIALLIFMDILFLLIVTAVPSARFKSVLVQLPYSVSVH